MSVSGDLLSISKQFDNISGKYSLSEYHDKLWKMNEVTRFHPDAITWALIHIDDEFFMQSPFSKSLGIISIGIAARLRNESEKQKKEGR